MGILGGMCLQNIWKCEIDNMKVEYSEYMRLKMLLEWFFVLCYGLCCFPRREILYEK